MQLGSNAIFIATAMVALSLAGCLDSGQESTDDLGAVDGAVGGLLDVIDVTVADTMNFTESVVDAAVGYTNDLYEPTMEVSDTGVIYVTGHTILVDTTGAPVFMSKDGGQSWSQLPFASSATMPADVHGATPPPSDEIFLVAGDDGWLYGVDITLLTFPINAWSGDGAQHAYHNPNAYDEAQAMTARADAVAGEDGSCSVANLNDRPWAAYGDGKLLLVNNPGGGPVQVGIMDVPQALPVGGPTVGPTGATWNLCAGAGGGAIPGIPDMRDDHFFAVPQVQGDELVIVKGHDGDVMSVQQVKVFDNTNAGPGTSNYGQVVFDAEGTLFVGIRNNTWDEEATDGNPPFSDSGVRRVVRDGQLQVAVSTDDGETFVTRTLRVGNHTTSVYLDGNMNGPGALLTWAQQDQNGTDWYAGHLYLGDDGAPHLENVSLMVDDGPFPSAHVQGAALGPDGEAYLVMYHGGYAIQDRVTPLSVWIQQDGPTMPVPLAEAMAAME